MPLEQDGFVIRGVTLSGKPFRPNDWAERLCSVMAGFGSDGRTQYSPYVFPSTLCGVRCVVVRRGLQAIAPMAFSFLLNFAKDNELQTQTGTPSQAEGGPAAAE